MPPRFYYISAISFLNYSITGKFELVYSKDHLKISGLQRDSLKMNTHAAVEASLTIEDKSLKGIVKITKRGYEAHRDRQRLKVYDVNDYLHYELYNPAILIGKKKLEHTEDTLSMVITYDFSSALTSANRDKLLFIDPQVFMPDEFTSLTAETRSYPVDLGSMIEKILIASLTIPENYAVDQLPENVILTLPDKSARFVKSMVVIGNKINIAIRLSTTRIIFNVPEYPALREFFMQVSAKRNEMIVLRKIE